MKKIVLFLLLFMVASQAQALTKEEYLVGGDYVGSRSPLYDQLYLHLVDFEAIDGAQIGPGTKYYVDSTVSGATSGTSWATAMDTMQEAIDLCTDNAGDYIYVAPNHAENVASAAAIDFDCPGVTVVGYGENEHQPTFSMITAATATVQISAADVTLFNLRFLGNYTNGITECLDVTANGDGARILGCQFRETSATKELLIMITVTADADEVVIAGNKFVGIATGTDSVAINFEGGSDQSEILSNDFYGDWSGYVIDASTAASIGLNVNRNTMNNLDTGAGKTMAFHTSSTGNVIGNACYGNGASFALVGDSMFIAADNIVMATENVETRNYETMFGPYRGDAAGTAGDSVFADAVLQKAETVLILEDTGTTIPDKIDVTDAAIAGLNSAIASIDATGFAANCTSNPANTSKAVSTTLAGFGDDYFNTDWSLKCMLDASGPGSAPEGEVIDITDYDSATGEFTVNIAFTAQLDVGDGIWVFRQDELNLEDATILGCAGTIRYVDSGTSGDGSGLTLENAYATFALAEAACGAGDVVYIADGHDEDIGDIVINEAANISFIGMGEGDARPLLTCNDNTDEITIDANGITIKNIRLQAGADQVVTAFRIEDAGVGCTLENISFIDGEGADEEFVICIDVDAAAMQLTVRDCTYSNINATTTHASAFIDLTDGTIDQTTIKGCTVFGEFANGGIYSNAVCTNLSIIDNVISNTTAAKYAIQLSAAATGVLVDNRLYSNDYATMLDPGSLKCSGNIGVDAIDQQGITMPISAETSDVTGVTDGSDLERLEYLQQLTNDALALHGVGTGDVFYVDSAIAGATGIDWATAVATIDDGVNLCTTNAGDYIFVAPGHVEDLGTTDPDFDKAGITCIGLGKGEQRPVLSFDTSTDIFTIDADDTAVFNLIFLAHTPDVAKGIDITSGSENAIIQDCLFTVETEGTDEFLIAINIGADADNPLIKNNEFFMGGGNATEAILQDGTLDYAEIVGNKIYGDYSTACIFGDSTGAGVLLTIRDNILYNGDIAIGLNTEPCIELKSDTTGFIVDNFCVCDVNTPDLAVVAADCYLSGNTFNKTEGAAFAASPVGLVAGKSYSLTMTMGSAHSDDLFLVAGGPIMITDLSFYCTTDVASTNTWTIILDHADKDVEFTSAVDVATANDGDRIVFSAANPAVITILALTNEVGSGNPMYDWFCPIGMIEVVNDDSTQVGVFEVYMTFIPLTNGVTVTPK